MPEFIEAFIQIAVALIGAYIAALWFCLVVWTFRDIQKRSRDLLVQILATLLVLLFNVPGLILYLILRPPETLSELYARSLGEESLVRDIATRHVCPHCHGQIDEDFRICPACRSALSEPCSSCRRLLHVEWSVCPYCTRPKSLPSTVAAEGGAVRPAVNGPSTSESPLTVRSRTS